MVESMSLSLFLSLSLSLVNDPTCTLFSFLRYYLKTNLLRMCVSLSLSFFLWGLRENLTIIISFKRKKLPVA